MKDTWYRKYANYCRRKGTNYIIKDRENNEPYLERFYLVPRLLLLNQGRVVLHRFWKSDDDNGFHDHPWHWASYILEGGYWEHTPEGTQKRMPGDWSGLRKATDLHRVELFNEGEEVWTLFFMGPRQREWGFIPNGTKTWINHQDYIANKIKDK